MIRYALCERLSDNRGAVRGLSCDEDGVFIAGDVSDLPRQHRVN